MPACLSHITAFNWLISHPRIDAVPSRRSCRAPCKLPGTVEARELIDRYSDLPTQAYRNRADGDGIDLLVGTQAARHRLEGINVHLCERKLPAGSIMPLRGDESICCPELVFVQLASELDLIGAVAAGYALCSGYRLDEFSAGGVVFRPDDDDEPLTSTNKIAAYLKKATGMCGVKRARRALRYVRDGSRSPRESALAMLYGLPTRLGGFALGEVALNRGRSVRRGGPAEHLTGAGKRYPDLTFTASGRDGVQRSALLEYNPFITHEGAGRSLADSVRRNELSTSGIAGQFEITDKQAKDYAALERVADQIRIVLKRRGFPIGSRWKRVDLWRRLMIEGEPQRRG